MAPVTCPSTHNATQCTHTHSVHRAACLAQCKDKASTSNGRNLSCRMTRAASRFEPGLAADNEELRAELDSASPDLSDGMASGAGQQSQAAARFPTHKSQGSSVMGFRCSRAAQRQRSVGMQPCRHVSCYQATSSCLADKCLHLMQPRRGQRRAVWVPGQRTGHGGH